MRVRLPGVRKGAVQIAMEIERPRGKEIQLMATCLCDAFFADLGRATVEVLEEVGCKIEFPPEQTCCGQPPFNGGDFAASRKVARHNLEVFAGEKPIVVPSGSCAAMQRHGNGLQFEGEADREAVAAMAGRTWEVFDFLVNGLGVKSWSGRLERKIAIHHSCHSRGTGTGEAMRRLLDSIEGIEIVEFGEAEQCCGFGGTFSVSFSHISGEMGTVKLDRVLDAEPDLLVSADMSCLMHLRGRAEREGRAVEAKHGVELLWEAMKGEG